MTRTVNRADSGRGSSEPATIPKPTRKPERDTARFRTVSRGLKVTVEPSERIDRGAGNYEIKPPRLVEFEDFGSYGEAVVDQKTAKILREIAKDREKRGLPAKYAEV